MAFFLVIFVSNATGGGGVLIQLVFVQIALASLIHSNLTAGYFKQFNFVVILNQPGSLSVAYFLSTAFTEWTWAYLPISSLCAAVCVLYFGLFLLPLGTLDAI